MTAVKLYNSVSSQWETAIIGAPPSGTKLSALAALSALAVDDLIELVDVSDTSMATTGTNKKVTVGDLRAALVRKAVNNQAGTTYAPTTADENTMVRFTSSSTVTVTMPSDATSAVPIGAEVDFLQSGSGQVTFAAGASATVNGTPGLKLRAQYSAATAKKVAASTWVIIGDLAA